jgi:hypothetical protein
MGDGGVAMILGLFLTGAALVAPAPGAVPPTGFAAPARFEMVIGAGVDGRPVCRAALNGERDGEELLCAMLMGEDAGAIVGQIPRDVTMTVNVTMALDSQELPPRSLVDRGELVLETSARISVDRGGRISRCDLLGTHMRGPLAGAPGNMDQSGPPLCEMPDIGTEAMFGAAPDGPAARSGMLHLELYLRVGATRTTA